MQYKLITDHVLNLVQLPLLQLSFYIKCRRSRLLVVSFFKLWNLPA